MSRRSLVLATAFVALIPLGWPALPFNLQPGDLLLVPLVASLFADGWRYRFHALDGAVVAYAMTSAASIPGSLAPSASILGVGKELYLIGVYLAVAAAAERIGAARLCRIFVASAATISAVSLGAAALYLTTGLSWSVIGDPMPLPYVGDAFRARGFVHTPELFGNVLTMAVPLAWVVWTAPRPVGRGWMLSTMLVAAAMTVSKSLGGLATACAVVAWPQWRGQPIRRAVLAAAAALLVIAFNVAAVATMRQLDLRFGRNEQIPPPAFAYARPAPGADTLDLRLSYNPTSYFLLKKVEWEAFRRRPWTGIGLAAFPWESQRAYDRGVLYSPYQRVDTHSTPMGRLAETGLLGAAGLVLVIVVVWRCAVAARRGSDGEIAWAALAGAAGVLVNSVNVDIMHFRFVWMAMGIVRACAREERDVRHLR